ncbi:unnamed protein product, partial [Symbiodinium sp. CCMP2592]
PRPRHLKILTWNAGGLGGKEGALFDELQVYANTHPFDVLLVQESKWTFSNMCEDSRWFFLHSGSTARDFKQGGVLIMLSKRIVDPGSVRFVEPLPGRILWAHFTHRGRPIDILNMYQHTWRGSERVAQLRHRALDVLTKSVQAVSLRSVLIVAGDFNAQCVPIDWQPWRRPRGQPRPPQIDRHAIADALSGTPDDRVLSFRCAVQGLLQDPSLTLDTLQDQVHALAVETFPAQRPPEAARPCQDVQLQGYAVRMWAHFRAFRKLRALGSSAPLSVIFRERHHKSAYNRMRAASRHRGAELRKQKRDRLFDTARAAASSGNLREFYKVVRLLARQGARNRFQLCQGGVPLAPERELEVMKQHFEQQFASHSEPPDPSATWDCDDPISVTVTEVQWHLDRLPDALRRVFSHCAEGRRLRAAHARNPHQRFAGLKIPAFQGGVQICLDLASAFDTVPHSLVREALLEAGVEAGPASLLLAWLESCSYDLHLSGLHTNIIARRGVKQGCPASPLLFAACTVLLARRIDLRLGSSWVSEHLTMFADDLHLASLFHSVAEFELECQRLGAAITVLRQHGLIIHPSKAQALLTCTGSQVKQTRQRFVKPLPAPAVGKGLRLRASGEDVLIPRARSADYLGAVISSDCFSAQTLEKRLAQGRTAQVQLRKVLNARKGLLLTQRVLLWRTTAWPCLLYGLGACGLTTAHLASLQTLALKQLRALSNSPAHIHHESDATLCLRLGVPMPRDALRRLHDRMLCRQVPRDDFVFGPHDPWTLYLGSCWDPPAVASSPAVPPPSASACLAPPPGLVQLEPQHPSLPTSLPLTAIPPPRSSETPLHAHEPIELPVSSAPVAPATATLTDPPPLAAVARAFPCSLCDRSFDTRKSLKLHMARSHQQHTATIVFNRALHAVAGLPTCAFCKKSFTR